MLSVNLKQCTFKGRRVLSSTMLKQFPTTSGPHRTWSDLAMQKAIEQEGVSLRQAAEIYEIPQSTYMIM